MAIRVVVTLLPPALLVVISLWQRMEVTSVISRSETSTRSLSMIQLKPELGKATLDMEQTPYSLAFEQLRMPGADTASESPSNCPHEDAGLTPFEDFLASHDASGDLIISSGRYLLSTSTTVGSLTVAENAELVMGENLELQTRGILVKGLLRAGSETCRVKGLVITFTGNGDKNARSTNPLDTKGLVAGDGGHVEVFGQRFRPTWTRLATSATAGESTLELMDQVDWEVGQELVVVTTAWTDEASNHQNEVRTITAVNGQQVTISEPLQFDHYGGLEYAAEVALLSRTIRFQGDDSSESSRYGGHVMCVPGSKCQIAGVLAYRMGQENVMGRYPFHFHLMGTVADSFFEDCTVQHSFFRAYTVHGTSSSRVSRNVAYDISGSAYYLEDGVEEDNLFDYNLAALVHIIDRLSDYDNGGGQGGVQVQTQPSRIVPTDATAVGFYCTNAKNRWIGNSASGGFSGFHFPIVPHALGDSASTHPNYKPDEMELLEFDSNTAHSSGLIWSRGACMYVGGKLWENNPGSQQYSYISGRASPARMGGRFIMTRTKVFACRMGMLFWGTHWSARKPELALEGYEAHDISRSSSQLGDTYIHNAVISAYTANTASDLPKVGDGFELYDTDMQTILAQITFRNYDRSGDVCIQDMTHSNIFKPQGMFHSNKIHFENTPMAHRLRHVERLACKSYHQDSCLNRCSFCPGTPGSSQTANLFDVDGSLSGLDEAAIIGADDADAETNGRTNEWWHMDDSCTQNTDWGFWLCPTHGHRSIVSLFIMKGIMSSAPERTSSNTAVGMLYHFGRTDRYLDVGLAESPMVTGACCDVGWYLHLDAGAVSELTIFLDQMVDAGGLVFATRYPMGASFTIQRCLPNCADVTQGNSLEDVLNAPGTVYYVDDKGRLYLKFLYEQNGYFEQVGVKQLSNGHRYLAGKGARYTIRSSGSGSVALDIPPALDGAEAPTTTTGTTGTGTIPATTVTTTLSSCPTARFSNCRQTLCCSNPADVCYEKDQYYAQCRQSGQCTPGISPNDPPEYQTPWSCAVLSTTETTTAATTTTTTAASITTTTTTTTTAATTTTPATTTTTTTTTATTTTTTLVTTTFTTTTTTPATTVSPTTTTGEPCSTSRWGNCRRSLCCSNPADVCYEKDRYYAQCRPSGQCTPGISPNDAPQYQTPWSCTVLSSTETTTSATTTTTTTTTPTPTTTTTTTTTTPTPTTSMAFEPVDGGEGRACRGARSNDNKASYYTIFRGVANMDECKDHCVATENCAGIEFNAGGRCEVWTREGGIQASIALDNYWCLRYGSPSPPDDNFEPVDGGVDRVCRGAHENDNFATYFDVQSADSLEACKGLCAETAGCKGIEYHMYGRCEIWLREDGIQASKAAAGYTCLRFIP